MTLKNHIFKNHIFISYAHIDNEPPSFGEHKDGWVSTFDDFLARSLASVLGWKPRIWRDRKLSKIDDFHAEIMDNLNSVLLVVILSPRYLQSVWCLAELTVFRTAAEKIGLHRIGNKYSIIKVETIPIGEERYNVSKDLEESSSELKAKKLEIDRDKCFAVLEELKKQLGHRFYTGDGDNWKQFSAERGLEMSLRLMDEVDAIVREIGPLLRPYKKLEKESLGILGMSAEQISSQDEIPQDKVSKEKTVYLAVTTSDLEEQRREVMRDLKERGYKILPNQELSLSNEKLHQVIEENLQQCQISVHFLGQEYGKTLRESADSIVTLQNQIAARQTQNSQLAQLIWIPPGLKNIEECQQQYINDLRQGKLGFYSKTELLETSLEGLKEVILDRLAQDQPLRLSSNQLTQTEQAVTSVTSRGKLCIYLDCTEKDWAEENINPLYRHLTRTLKYKVLPPDFSGQTRNFMQEGLKQADAVLIYHSHDDATWLDSRLMALEKSEAFHPKLAKAIYATTPSPSSRPIYEDSDVLVIEQFEAFSGEDLKPFLEQLSQQQQGAT